MASEERVAFDEVANSATGATRRRRTIESNTTSTRQAAFVPVRFVPFTPTQPLNRVRSCALTGIAIKRTRIDNTASDAAYLCFSICFTRAPRAI